MIAVATADRIILEGMEFYGYHGHNAEERALGQPFVVDLEAEVDLKPAGLSDDIADTVNYADLYRSVKGVMEGPGRELLESLAQAIAQDVLDSHPVLGVRVRVKKPRPPIKGAILSGVAVEIHRFKE